MNRIDLVGYEGILINSAVEIGDYLIQQILAHQVRHIFGVPGDYLLKFFKKMSDSSLEVVNKCDEQGAGFAADAYARLDANRMIYISSDRIAIGHHTFEGVTSHDFLAGLLKQSMQTSAYDWPRPKLAPASFEPTPGTRITIQRLFQQVNAF